MVLSCLPLLLHMPSRLASPSCISHQTPFHFSANDNEGIRSRIKRQLGTPMLLKRRKMG